MSADKGLSDLAVLLVWTVAEELDAALSVKPGADIEAAMDAAAAQVDAILAGPAAKGVGA